MNGLIDAIRLFLLNLRYRRSERETADYVDMELLNRINRL